MATIEFATLFAAAAFFAWATESWRDTTKNIVIFFFLFVLKIVVNEIMSTRFTLTKLEEWTPLTWGALGLFLGAVMGAALRGLKPPSA